MKRLFSFVAVAVAAFAFASCAKSEREGAEATMSLSVNIPDAVGTKAYGDGMFADKTVIVGVFDEDGNELFRKATVFGAEEFTKEIQIRFVMGRSYQMVVFAQYGDAYGAPETVSLRELTLKYTASNMENLDAFYAYVPTFTVKQDFSKTVVLKRPFAQINFATAVHDIDESVGEGYLGLSDKAIVTVKNLANTLDFFTGATAYVDESLKAEAQGKPVTVPETAFPKVDGKYPQIEVDGVKYEVISMNYVLVADAGCEDGKTTVDLTLQVGELEINVPSAYLKRNYRTNVVGELLTAEGSFNVTVDPIFTDSFGYVWNE